MLMRDLSLAFSFAFTLVLLTVNNYENIEYRVENITIPAYVFLFLYLYHLFII